MEKILLSEMIPTDVLQAVQDAFSKYSGLAAMIADANGVPVTKQSGFTDFCKMTRQSECGSLNCQKCGREGAHRTLESGKPSVYHCHTGMVDFAAPILLNGEYIGHFAGGQTRVEKLDEEFLTQKAIEYGIAPEEYIEAAKRNTVTDYASVEKAAEFLAELAKALSKIAYERIEIRRQKEVIDSAATRQLNFMREYAADAGAKLPEVVSFLQKLADGELDVTQDATKDFSHSLADYLRQRVTSINASVNRNEIGRGELMLREGKYELRMLLERKAMELAPLCETEGVALQWEVSEEAPEVLVGDSSRISDIIGIWVELARKYEAVSEICISASTRKKGYGTELILWIHDNGTGPEETAKKQILDHIRSREGKEIWSDDYREKGVSVIGHLLHAMSGSVEMGTDDNGTFGITFTIPQLAA